MPRGIPKAGRRRKAPVRRATTGIPVTPGTPSARPRHERASDFVTVFVPKETANDLQEPGALIHHYCGEDSEFKSAVIEGETPRQFKVRIKRTEAEAPRLRGIEEAKARLRRGSDMKSELGGKIVQDEIIPEAKVSLAEYASDAVKAAEEQLVTSLADNG